MNSGRTTRRGDEYEPVPDDLLTVLERLVDAAEDVIAWYEIWFEDINGDDLRDAIDTLRDVIIRTGTYLGDNP